MTQRRCRLYLIVPGGAGPDFADSLGQALGVGDIACVAMAPRAGGQIDRALAHPLMRVAHGNGVPFVLAGDPAAARALSADGVHIMADQSLYAQARRVLGSEAIIGAACGHSRHDALLLAEQGADYVAFGPVRPGQRGPGVERTIDLVAWWAELVEVPCVAWDLDSVDAACRAAKAGADFVALGEAVWQHAQSPAVAVGEILAALDPARDKV